MAKSAKVKVRLDTRQAKADLRGMAKEGEATAARVNESLGGGFGRAATLGAAAGVGFGLAQRAASRLAGFIPDQIGEATAGTRASIDSALGGPEARATRQAREETKAAYAEIVGRQKAVTPEVRQYFNSIKDLRQIREEGANAINDALGGHVVEDAIGSIISTVKAGFDAVIDALPFGGK